MSETLMTYRLWNDTAIHYSTSITRLCGIRLRWVCMSMKHPCPIKRLSDIGEDWFGEEC